MPDLYRITIEVPVYPGEYIYQTQSGELTVEQMAARLRDKVLRQLDLEIYRIEVEKIEKGEGK